MIDGAPANVRDYGAVGDGVTNDTAAFQAAIDNELGQPVYVPNGEYALNAVQLRSDLTLFGENNVYTDLVPTANDVTIFEVANSAATLRLSFFNVHADGKTGCTFFNQINKALFISHPIFEDIIIDADLEYGFKGSFIYGTWDRCRLGHAGSTASNTRHIAIHSYDDSASPAAGHVFSLGMVRDCFFYNGKTTGVTAEGLASVNIHNGDVWAFERCSFESNDTSGAGAGAVYSEGTRELRFTSCWFEAVCNAPTIRGNVGSIDTQGALISVDSCRFSNHLGPPSHVFHLDSASNLFLSNSEFALGGSGLVVQGGGGNVIELTSNMYDSTPTGFNNMLDKNRYKRSGTFQVVFTTSGSAITIDPSFDTLSYTLNGDSCHIQGRIRVSAVHATPPSGTLYITGLPFTSSTAAETPDIEFSQVGYESLGSAVGVGLIGIIEPNTTAIHFKEQTTTTLADTVAANIQAGTLLYINATYKIG